jgi:catechol 2,3-dioxygenase-like lactoylglutathione lyase family enzyme
MAQALPSLPRDDKGAVHSVDHFVFTVPDLAEAERFYTDFGLDVRPGADRVDLYTFSLPHRWGSIHAAPGRKKLQYLSFGIFAPDLPVLEARLDRLHIARADPHPLGDGSGVWLRDPEGVAVQVRVGPKVSANGSTSLAPTQMIPGRAAAPPRSAVRAVRPRRLSHVLLFSSNVPRSTRFYCDALGLRLSDQSGDGIAFMHAVHSSDHHVLAFAKSDGSGLHHSSWDVASIEEVGLGMQQMVDHGHTRGWGVGRHVLGSNYFYYACDPWGSFAEYSHGIDFIPAGHDWKAADHPPEDSFYLWGPPPPDYFVMNNESAGAP